MRSPVWWRLISFSAALQWTVWVQHQSQEHHPPELLTRLQKQPLSLLSQRATQTVINFHRSTSLVSVSHLSAHILA